jgi:hypothetical protein
MVDKTLRLLGFGFAIIIICLTFQWQVKYSILRMAL